MGLYTSFKLGQKPQKKNLRQKQGEHQKREKKTLRKCPKWKNLQDLTVFLKRAAARLFYQQLTYV